MRAPLSLEEIKQRLGDDGEKNIGDYIGFDFAGETRESRINNFKLLKENFSEHFWDFEWDNFRLHTRKGVAWWGEACDFENRVDLAGWASSDIIQWIMKNKCVIEKQIARYISKEDRFEVLKRQRWSCNQCGCKLKYSKNNEWVAEVAHIDHIHPFSERDTYLRGAHNINEPCNLQALCPKCNLTKSSKKVH